MNPKTKSTLPSKLTSPLSAQDHLHNQPQCYQGIHPVQQPDIHTYLAPAHTSQFMGIQPPAPLPPLPLLMKHGRSKSCTQWLQWGGLRVVPTTFMINYSQPPARRFDRCLGFYEMKYIGQRYEMYLIPLQGFISFQSHFYFVPTQPFISLSFLLYFILISFLPSYLFHCLPKMISLVFHCCFIACPGQHHWYFIAVSLPA